jgi:hypothetical protein
MNHGQDSTIVRKTVATGLILFGHAIVTALVYKSAC